MNHDIEIARAIAGALERGESVVLATVVKTRGSTPRKAGAKMIVHRDGSASGTICGGCVEAEVYARAIELFGSGRSELLSFTLNDDAAAEFGLRCGGMMEVFLEKMSPRARLYIIGAGHIGQALAGFARALDFDVHVLDDHPGFLTEERFAGCTLHRCALEDVAGVVPEGEHIAAVIATRGHKEDATALHALIDRKTGYLGLVTSRKRVMEFYRPLLARGVSEERLRKIAAPVGLDLGSQTPEEIALAIIAETLAVMRGAGKRSLSTEFWESDAGKKLPELARLSKASASGRSA